MIRALLVEIGLFVAPFVLYGLYVVASPAGKRLAKAWTRRRVASLFIISLVLVVGSFFALAQFSGARPNATYVPAHLEDGRLVPGAAR